MLLRFRLFLVAALMAAPAVLSCSATELIFANGDRLTGHVIKRENGKVYFHSQALGDIVALEKDVTIVDKPVSPVPPNSLTGLPPQKKAAPTQAKPTVTPWSGKVEVGYDNQLTNIRTVSTTAKVTVNRTVDQYDIMGTARYLYGSSAGLPTTDLTDGEFRVRDNLDSQFFLQSDSTAGDNKIQEINFEGQENVGAGVKVIKTERSTVDIGAGVSGQYLNAYGIQEGWNYLGNVFQDYTFKINGRYTFLEDVWAQYSPQTRERFGGDAANPNSLVATIGSDEDYAYKFHTTLQGMLTKHLSLNLHWEYEYNNAILDNSLRGEERITTTLGYGF